MPIKDGNGSGYKTMPALAQATRKVLESISPGPIGRTVGQGLAATLTSGWAWVCCARSHCPPSPGHCHCCCTLPGCHRASPGLLPPPGSGLQGQSPGPMGPSPDSSEEIRSYLHPRTGMYKLPVSHEAHHGTVPTSGRQIQAVEESSGIVIGPKEGAMSMTPKGVSDTHHTYWQFRHLGEPGCAAHVAWAVSQDKPPTG